MRQALTAGQTVAIETMGAKTLNLALISGEVNYRIGDNSFSDTTDLKLTEDVRTDSIDVSRPTTIHVKAIQASVIQYRRE